MIPVKGSKLLYTFLEFSTSGFLKVQANSLWQCEGSTLGINLSMGRQRPVYLSQIGDNLRWITFIIIFYFQMSEVLTSPALFTDEILVSRGTMKGEVLSPTLIQMSGP